MKKTTSLGLVLLTLLFARSITARVLDNFDDNSKTGWTDFTFVPGVGLPSEQNGQFHFEIPGAVPAQAGALFSASQKVSESFELKEGRTIEFRADVVSAGGKDSFAVLGFLPVGSSPGTLSGYSMAKSTTDVLITKGVNKYFVADSGEAANLKNENITLVLSLTAKDGSVIIHGQVLDKDSNNAVIWDKTVVDTAAADVLASGTDSPAAPFITSGYFTLFCYADYDKNAPEDPYTVTYDNAEVYLTDTAVLDNFDDNSKTDWTDFTFVPGIGLPVEQNGQFHFEIPGAVPAQAGPLFSASQKTSRAFSLAEGEKLEFSVDLVSGGGKDSFAVLGFLPTGNSPGTLSGYSLAKSTTDVLITKGVNKYFVADSGAAADLKNENVTLVLSLLAREGSVIITGRVLDKDADNAVIWEKTVVDTPAADVLADGTDSPAEPYLGNGYFTLFCYADYDKNAPEDPYTVTYDNATVSSTPVATNLPPVISSVLPSEFASFLPASTQVSFQVADDHPLSTENISVTLNGTVYSSTNGLTLTGTGNSRTATLGGLAANVNYAAVLSAKDADGASATRTIYFDTFATNNLVIEAEDYNFDGGSFIDNPIVVGEGGGPQSDAYSGQTGIQGIDFNDTETTPNAADTPYRPNDPVRMNHTLDNARAKFTEAGGGDFGIFDYDVQAIAAGEWLNYTRTFPAGTYEVYLRESVANMASGESVLEMVTSDPKQENQTTRVLGSFLGTRTGFQYRNFPLTDGTGANKVILRLSGVTTLRLRQVTPDPSDGERHENYLIFVPVADPGAQPAAITSISPAPDTATETLNPAIRVEIQNRDTSVKTGSVTLTLNGQAVTPVITSDTNGAVVSFTITTLPASGATNVAKISFQDSLGNTVSNQWSFVITYKSLNAANLVSGTGKDRGFKYRIVQAPIGSGLANTLQRAEDQLASSSTIPKFLDTNFVVQVINFNQVEADAGTIPGDQLVPGLEPDVNGTDDYAVEIETYLDLTAGLHRFGIVCDDGFKLIAGASLTDNSSVPLDFHNGGPANQTIDFLVPAAGLYPFRLVWYNRGGGGHLEWFSVDPATGDRTLINDPDSATAVKAYASVTASTATLKVESAAAVSGPYTTDSSAVINTAAHSITIPMVSGANRFFRLNSSSGQPAITGVRVSGANLVFDYNTLN